MLAVPGVPAYSEASAPRDGGRLISRPLGFRIQVRNEVVTICDHLGGEESVGRGGEMSRQTAIVKVGTIQQRILLIRGENVVVDADLAEFYRVTAKALNHAVRRNRSRFPEDFVFRLTRSEKSDMVANCDHLEKLKYSPSNPYAFTEHGAIMAAAVLNSRRAVDVSVFIVRAFVALRRAISEH